jgi:hypothetical protein
VVDTQVADSEVDIRAAAEADLGVDTAQAVMEVQAVTLKLLNCMPEEGVGDTQVADSVDIQAVAAADLEVDIQADLEVDMEAQAAEDMGVEVQAVTLKKLLY